MPLLSEPRVRFRFLAAATAGYWTALIVLTHMPLDARKVRPGGVVLPPWSDKVFHVGAFGLLALLLTAACDAWARLRPPTSVVRRAFAVWGVVAAYALVDELTQPLTGRFCDPWDWLADVVGAAAGILLLRIVSRG